MEQLVLPPPNQISLTDAVADALRIFDISTARDYININTSTNKIAFGNIVDNQSYDFLGTGTSFFDGSVGIRATSPGEAMEFGASGSNNMQMNDNRILFVNGLDTGQLYIPTPNGSSGLTLDAITDNLNLKSTASAVNINSFSTITMNNNVDLVASKTGALVSHLTSNTSNTASSQAAQLISVAGALAADPFTRYTIAGVTDWATGIDNSDSNKYKISNNATLGTNDYLTIDTSGGVKFVGALDMTSQLINNVLDPVSAQDAATRNYVDTHSGNQITKVGTPLDNQVAVWAGDGPLEGTIGLQFDSSINELQLRSVAAGFSAIAFRNNFDAQIGGIAVDNDTKNMTFTSSGNVTFFSNADIALTPDVIAGKVEIAQNAITAFRATTQTAFGSGSAPPSSAIVQIVSTTAGFLQPVQTETQRDVIGSPVAGLSLYNSTTNKPNFFNGTAWTAAGDVSKVGTPVNNQVAVWVSADAIEGTGGLTFDGNTFLVSSGTSGDAKFILEADTDNNNEGDQPSIELRQDGSNVVGFFGYEFESNNLSIKTGEAGGQGSIGFYTGSLNPVLRLTLTQAGKLGLGTSDIPHAGVGAAKFAIDGSNASSSAGPHIQVTTVSDNFPLFQNLNFTHDNIALSFDAYFDGTWKSGDSGSNFQIHKNSDRLTWRYDSGIAQGAPVPWDLGVTLDTSGNYGIGVIPTSRFHVLSPGPDTTAINTIESTGPNGASSKGGIGDRDPNGNRTGAGGDTHIRASGDTSNSYECLEATTGTNWFKRSLNASNVKEINTGGKFEELITGGGLITPAANNTWFLKAFVSTTTETVLNSGISLHVSGQFIETAVFDYTGSGDFFSGQGTVRLFAGSLLLGGASSTLVNMTGTGTVNFRDIGFVGWNNLGGSIGGGQFFGIDCFFLDIGSGFTITNSPLINVTDFALEGSAFSDSFFTLNTNNPASIFNFTDVSGLALSATGSLFDISPKTDKGASINIKSCRTPLGNLFKPKVGTDAIINSVADAPIAAGTITKFEDDVTGVSTKVFSTTTYFEDEIVTHTLTTSYNGTFQIFEVDPGVSYKIRRAFVADDATGTITTKRIEFSLATGHGISIGNTLKGANTRFYNIFYVALNVVGDVITANDEFVKTDTGNFEINGSLDQTDPRINAKDNGEFPDSQSIAFGFKNGNATETVITTTQTYVPLEIADIEIDLITEGFRLVSGDRFKFKYIRKKPFKGDIDGSITLIKSGGSEAVYRIATGINSVVPNFDAAVSATVAAGGTGYTVGDDMTVSGGTSSVAAVFNVDAVSGGVVTAVSLVTGGAYTVEPTNPASTTGGTGTGCTLNVTYDKAVFVPLRVKAANKETRPLKFSADLKEGDIIELYGAPESGTDNITVTDTTGDIR